MTVGLAVFVKRPFLGRMKPIGARHGSSGLRLTTAWGTSSRSRYSTPFAVKTAAPRAPCCGNVTVPSRPKYGRSQPIARPATREAAITRSGRETTTINYTYGPARCFREPEDPAHRGPPERTQHTTLRRMLFRGTGGETDMLLPGCPGMRCDA
jgi:hypothetical protein